MSQTPSAAQPQPATVAQIKAECVGANSDFVVAQIESGATIDQAKAAWIKEQAAVREREAAAYKAELEAKNKEIEELKAAKAVAPKSGIKAVSVASAASAAEGNAKDQWMSLHQANLEKGMNPQRSIKAIEQSHPGLRDQMIDEDNA